MKHEPTVFVVDDDQAVRDALHFVIHSSGRKVETYPSAEAFLEAYHPTRPGCLVLDVRMPGVSGLSLQQTLVERRLPIPIIFISAHGTVPTAVRAMHAGAFDFLTKPFDNEVLLDRIEQCIKRDQATRARLAEQDKIATRLAQLTPRERQVMDFVVAGKLNKEIAAELGLSQKTVEAHRAKVMEKMQAGSLAELVQMTLTQETSQGKP